MLNKVMDFLTAIILSPLLIYIVIEINDAKPRLSNPQLSLAYNNTISNIETLFSIIDIKCIIMPFFIISIILLGVYLYIKWG